MQNINMKPVRNALKTNRKKPKGVRPRKGAKGGVVPSIKTGRAIRTESTLETAAAQLLEINPDVVSFTEQPFRFDFTLDDREHTYTADLGAEHRGGRLVAYEVKPSEKLKDPVRIRKYAAIRNALYKQGWAFEILTEKTLNRQPRLTNTELIYRYSEPAWKEEELRKLIAAFAGNPSATMGEVVERLKDSRALNLLCTAMRAGVVAIDMSRAFGDGSLVWLVNAVIGGLK